MQQQTIKNVISFSGKGLHTGKMSNLRLIPSAPNSGIVFKRIDLSPAILIKANIENVTSSKRSTNLGKNNINILTVEHLLAAITGNEIDNILIEIDNIEVPILDGSSIEFCEKIQEIGIKKQNEKKKFFKIRKKIVYRDKKYGSEFIALPSNNYSVEININYQSNILGNQNAKIEKIQEFNKEISKARTFCFLHEIEDLLKNNLIKGGDIKNSIVIIEKKINKKILKKLSLSFGNPKIQTQKEGFLNNTKLHYKNEPARHKLLDVIGDLSLIGRPIQGKIIATKPGHTHNTNFAKKLEKIMKEEIENTQPEINFEESPLYDKEKIKTILPHREPFLLIDEIRSIDSDHIIGVKYVDSSEYYFNGHFPGKPIMPGVLQLETMAQVGGVLILNTVDNPKEYLTYFMKIDNAKFKKKVVPGDKVIFRLTLISPIRRGLCHMHGKGFVNEECVVEADLLAQIAKK